MPYRYITQQAAIVRSYYTGLGKTGIIYPAAFLVALALGQFGLGLVFYMREHFGCTTTQIGWLSAVWSLSYVVGCLLIRPFFDHVLPRHMVVIATALASAITGLITLVPSIVAVFLLHGIYGLVMSFFWPPLMGWLSTDAEGKALGRMVSRFNLSWSIGGIISPLVAATLSQIGSRLPLYAGSGVFLVTAAYIAIAVTLLPKARTDRTPDEQNGDSTPVAGRDTLLRYPAWVGVVAGYFGMSVIASIFPIMATGELHMQKPTVGTLLFLRSLTNAIAFVILGRTIFWHFRAAPMLAGQFVCAGAFVALGFVASPAWIGALFSVFGVTLAITYSVSIFHGASGSANRAARAAIHESVLAGGLVAGSSIGGMVYSPGHASRVFWLCAAVVLAGLVVQAIMVLRSWRQTSR
jgi:predicted MFS family arabinose efflux permease